MSIIKSKYSQVGTSSTATQNFTLDASAQNGTMKLVRGNASAGTQDIMTVAADGTVAFPQNAAALPSMVKVNTGNGWGSGNCIRRFSNFTNGTNGAVIQGTDITFADASSGATFTVNTNGIYALTYSERYSAASVFGISINASNLTSSITSNSTTERLVCADTAGANYENSTSWTGYLVAGSVIRAHGTTGLSEGSMPAVVAFTIVRVA